MSKNNRTWRAIDKHNFLLPLLPYRSEDTMKNTMIAVATICLLWTAAVTVYTSEAATVIAGAIIGIDQTQRTITYQTEDGRTWTLPVADSNILKQERIAKGDQVRVEVELNDSDMSKRITKITKISDPPPSKPNGKP
jgi:hypothetical protein